MCCKLKVELKVGLKDDLEIAFKMICKVKVELKVGLKDDFFCNISCKVEAGLKVGLKNEKKSFER